MGKDGLNSHLVFAVVAAALGSGFQHGYHTGVINLPEMIFRNWENETYNSSHGEYLDQSTGSLLWGTSTSIMNLGGTVGGLITGVLVKKLGPKMVLILNNILLLIACLLMSFGAYDAGSVECFIVGRCVIGINCGLNAGVCPMYLSEIAPVRFRGAFASVYQLVITISILLAMICGLDYVLGNEGLWRNLFLIPLLFGLFQVVALFFCPDSPRYIYAIKTEPFKAEKALKWLRKAEDVSEEMDEHGVEYRTIRDLPPVSLKDMFVTSKLRTPLIIAVMLMLAQQFSGINAIIFYSTTSFKDGGLTDEEAKYATILVGVVNVLMTVVSVYLVEVAGRKTLLLVGFGGMAIDTAIIAVALMFSKEHSAVPWICIILVIIYIILFAAGAGSIPWFLVTELFDQATRPTAVSLAVPTNWIANFVVTLTFPLIRDAIHSYVFFIFTILNVFFFFFILFKVPETKNKPIEEIIAQFK